LGKSVSPLAVIKSMILQFIFARFPNSTVFKVRKYFEKQESSENLLDEFVYCMYCKIGQYCLIIICNKNLKDIL